MRKLILGLALSALLLGGGCRAIYGTAGKLLPMPHWLSSSKWVDKHVLNIYTDNGHYDGRARWDNFTRQWQQIQNFASIHFFNYDIRDPYLNAPFFGDPR